MALRKKDNFCRQAFRAAFHLGLGVGAFAVTNLTIVSPALAQLRTGRNADREFYSPAESVKEVTSPSKRKPVKSEVVQASANEEVFTADEFVPIRKPKLAQSNLRSDRVTNPPSRVVQAGCKNCQAGIPHSHGPIAAGNSNETSHSVIENGDYEESSLSDVIYDQDAMVFGSSNQHCQTACDTGSVIQPQNVLGNLLRRMHLRFEAATFWPEGQNLPQLVTTRRPANDPATDGLIGRTDTTNLFGGSEVLGETTQGIRGELGTYFGDCKSYGVLLRFFDASSSTLSYNSTPTSEPVVMRPFFSTANNAQSTIAVNYPGSTSGSLNANISSEVYGGDILFRKLILRDCAGRIEFLAGYQTARLADSLVIDSTTTALTNTPAPAGTVSQLSDRFMTTNRFNGMALGLNGILRERCWSLSGMVKLGLGNMERSVSINGNSTITVPGNPGSTNTSPEGLLARNTNAGNYVFSTFIVSPETNVTLGYRLTRCLEATVGYSYLGLPKAARVADQLDPQLAANLSNPPSGASTPAFSLRESNYSLHSLDYGLQWRY